MVEPAVQSLPLKAGAVPAQALQTLGHLATELGNLPGKRAPHLDPLATLTGRQEDYLRWVDSAEVQLGNFTDEAVVDALLKTRAYWAIRDLNPQTAQPFLVIESEIRAQKTVLERLRDDLVRRVDRVLGAPGRIAVLDTNVLLHYQSPENVDWSSVVGAKLVRLLIPMVVVDELDEKKNMGGEKVRQKARDLLPRLERMMGEDGSPGPVREGVTIEVELADASHGRRGPDADGSILDACSQLERLAGAENGVTLVTADMGMKMRAAQRGIQAVTMPDSYRRVLD